MIGLNNRYYLKIVKIIDEYHVVINAGSSQGVKKGDVFQICAPSVNVVDPETGEKLGALEHVKATIEATEVYQKMAVCKNHVNAALIRLNIGGLGKSVGLRVDAAQISGGFDNVIRLGDTVKAIDPDSEDEE